MNKRTKWSAQLFAVLLCALALKRYYSTASVDELGWILGPTTWLTQLLSGRTFSFESHAGYMSSDHAFLIAASCAGVNFLITSFLLLALKQLWNQRWGSFSWRFIPIAALSAYVSTLIANTVRICIALELQQHPVNIGGLSGNQIHRFEGIVVYFGFLVFLFLVTEKPRADLNALIKLSIFPLVIYYVTTLGIPLANGSLHRPDFWEHALFVLAIPLLVMLPVLGWRALMNWRMVSHSAAACGPTK